jgi:predicted transcriptional regulator
MQSKLYSEYAVIDAQIKKLEAQKEDMRISILKDLMDNGIENHETVSGIFSIVHKTKWKYTDSVKKLEDKVKIAKIHEEKKGTAIPEETSFLMFKIKEN